MSWHVYRIFRVAALCALFSLHSALIGITASGMLGEDAGGLEALQFSMDIIVLFTILCFFFLKYKRRNAEPTRILNLIAFFAIFVLSLVGAIGLTARAASGKGLCEDFASKHPGNCVEAAVAMTFTWASVVIAGAGVVVSWLERSSRMGSSSNLHDWERPEKDPGLREQLESTFRSSFSYVPGPTASYVPRPRHPYDTPRRRPTHSKSHQLGPQRVPSNKTPALPLPPLPSFYALDLEADAVATRRINRKQTSRTRSDQRERKDLPELPPPTRRAPEDPHQREIRRMRYLSPTDMFAQIGG